VPPPTGRIATWTRNSEQIAQVAKKILEIALKRNTRAASDWQNRNMDEEFRTDSASRKEMLGVSQDTVRRLFDADEPGIVDLGRRETTLGRRRYRLLKILDSVFDRVLNRKRRVVSARHGQTQNRRRNPVEGKSL